MLIRNSAEEAGGMAQWVKVFTTKLIANSRVLQAEKAATLQVTFWPLHVPMHTSDNK